jgi:hypothetical protein
VRLFAFGSDFELAFDFAFETGASAVPTPVNTVRRSITPLEDSNGGRKDLKTKSNSKTKS